jgi:hypothetical protein
VSQGPGSRLSAWGISGAIACPRGSRLSARGTSRAATCPRGSGSRLPARGGSGAATRRLGSSTRHLAQGSSEVAKCPEDGLYKLQAIKQISLGDLAMISIGARARVSSKALCDKGCSARSQGVRRRPIKYRRDVWAGSLQGRASIADLQPGHSGLPQCRVVQQLWAGSAVRQVATVRLQSDASTVGHLSGTATGLVTQRHHAVPLTECMVAGYKTRHAHIVEDIICYS